MKTFGHQRPVRDASGTITHHTSSPAAAVTREPLGPAFGADKKHRLVVTLDAGDLITMRPAGTRRTYQARAADVFRWILQCEANRANLERARAAKERKAIRLAADRQRRAELRLRRPVLQ